MSDVILSVKDLKVNYGGIEAVKGISFDVPRGEIVTLIGANGAGKSTTLKAIAGLVKPSAGSIEFNGANITGKDSSAIVASGITLVPEGRRVFDNMTVLENIKIGAYLRTDSLDDDIEWVYSLFPRLKERSWQLAGTLSGGEQQMLAVARALMSHPQVIMMDEPSLGLAPLVVKGIFDIIREINKNGIRKMTPREWARLQGFPDDYKLVLADVHLYKQFGNSVTVPVIQAIAEKIKEVLDKND